MMKNCVAGEHNQMNNILCLSRCHRSVHKDHWYINQSTRRGECMEVKYSVLKISASRQYVQNCREFSPSGTISHHLRFSTGAGWSVHSSARSETLSIPQSVFISSKSFEILSPARQWSSWVRCQVLKYCLDLSICLFIIPHFDYGVIYSASLADTPLLMMMRTATGHMCRGQTEQRSGICVL